MNKIVKPLVIAVVALVAVGLAKNIIAKSSAEAVCRAITGLELRIGGFDLSFLRSSLSIKNLRLFNPSGYEERVMFDVPEVFVSIERSSIFSGSPHLKEVRLYLKELTVVKNKDGQLNVMALKPQSKKDEEKGKPSQPAKAPQISIDLLNLRVDRVVYKDYSSGGSPNVQTFEVGLNETYRGITNINAIVPLIVQKAIMNTAIARLAGLNITDLVSNFSGVGVDMGSLGVEKIAALTGDLTKTGTALVGDMSKTLADSGAPAEVGEAAGKVAGEATKAVSGLFGALTEKSK